MTECPGFHPSEDDDGDYCACSRPTCGMCRAAHALPGTHLCQPCATAQGPLELAEALEASARYAQALAAGQEDPTLADLDDDHRPMSPDECAESYATVDGSIDEARCAECGGPACTHCEAHLTAPHAACEECRRQLIHVLIPTRNVN
ncbi:hypothetical protein ACIOWI_32995 [Streptomyces sp. NPDC087659]|uniref:hypothetical protein n=1 Tax=Streptomyces sp. NPDC087659 TaxID=3365801 RepID=UPI0037F9CBFF